MTLVDASDPNAAELRQLCTALDISEGFALYFVQCSVPSDYPRLTEQIQTQCTKPIAPFTIPRTLDTLIDVWLAEQVKTLPSETVIFLYGLEHHLPTHTAESELIAHRTLQQLNWQRNAYQRLHRSLVIWVPRYAMNLIARYASDFYDWRTAVFEFALPRESMQRTMLDFERGKVHNQVDGMTLEEKHRWLRVLKGLIAELETVDTEREQLASLLNDEGELYLALADYPYAESSLKKALDIREHVLGPDHPDVATSLNNLAALYKAQGEYAQAKPLYERSLAISEQVLGPHHPHVALSLNNLASLYQAQGEYDQAKPLYERSLAINEKVLGKEHPLVANSLNGLASLYQAQGEYDQAKPLLERSLAIREKVLGKEHPNVATSLNNLALLYDAQGEYDKAQPLFERALAILKKTLGEQHPNTQTVTGNYQVLFRTGSP